MPTLLDIISECLIDCAELGQGEVPSPEDGAYMMGKANELNDSLSTERLNVWQIQELTLALTNKQTFTIGPGAADFNQARPIKIESCIFTAPVNGVQVRTGQADVVGEMRWRQIKDLSATSNLPEMLYPDQASPIMGLNFYPIPLCAVATFALLSTWLPLQQFAALTDDFSMPTGYLKAFVDALKVVTKESYGHPLTPTDAAMEQTSRDRIRQLNAQLQNLGLFSGIPPSPPPGAPAQ